jgi:hypothetical protein
VGEFDPELGHQRASAVVAGKADDRKEGMKKHPAHMLYEFKELRRITIPCEPDCELVLEFNLCTRIGTLYWSQPGKRKRRFVPLGLVTEYANDRGLKTPVEACYESLSERHDVRQSVCRLVSEWADSLPRPAPGCPPGQYANSVSSRRKDAASERGG